MLLQNPDLSKRIKDGDSGKFSPLDLFSVVFLVINKVAAGS